MRRKASLAKRRRLGIHKRVKARRLEMGLSEQQVADRLGIHQSVYHRIESGAVGCSAERVADLARIFGTSVAYLYGEESDPEGARP